MRACRKGAAPAHLPVVSEENVEKTTSMAYMKQKAKM